MELNTKQLERLFNTRPANAKPPEWDDLRHLYQWVRDNKPDTILEYGSGCSTVVMAQALKDNRRGFLHSVDAERQWAEATTGMLDGLEQYASVIYGPVVKVHGGFKHEVKPPVKPDMVYVDGPELEDGHRYIVDVLDYKPQTIIVNARKEQCAFLADEMPEYSIHKDSHSRNTVFVRESDASQEQ